MKLWKDKRLYRLLWIWCYPTSFHKFSFSFFYTIFSTQISNQPIFSIHIFNNRYHTRISTIFLNNHPRLTPFLKWSKDKPINRFLSPLNRERIGSQPFQLWPKYYCPLTFLSREKHAPPEGVRSPFAGRMERDSDRRHGGMRVDRMAR